MTALEVEVWRPVVGASKYEVSDLGRVRSWYSRQECRRAEPHYMSTRCNPTTGYPAISVILDSGTKKRRHIHALVCESFIGPRPQGMEIRHINGVPSDNRLSNLTYGTPKENQADRRLHGTQALGTDRHNSKLSYLKAKAIRMLYDSGQFGYNDLAEVFDVGTGTIRKIINGITWRDVDAPTSERLAV